MPRILVVEDEMLVRMLIVDVLDELGYQAVGFIDNDAELQEVDGLQVLGPIDILRDCIRQRRVDEVIIEE